MSDYQVLLTLKPEDYGRYGCDVPPLNAPQVGLLFGREDGYFCSPEDLVKALVLAGFRVLFLDYEQHLLQIPFCNALVLPGGSFDTPEWYYVDAKSNDRKKYPSKRCRAYADSLHFALAKRMPVLGICVGMQVMAAEMGLKLYRSQDYVETPLQHNTLEVLAHHVDLLPNTPFYNLMDEKWRLPVNSRHTALVAPMRVQKEELETEKLPLDFYAFATDGIPEAIGKMEQGILGVQWHPENYAAAGDKMQLRIFDWLVTKAWEYHREI